jgi:hypothetical protein
LSDRAMQAALRPQLLAHLLHMDRRQAYVGMCTERYHNVMPLILSTETKVLAVSHASPRNALSYTNRLSTVSMQSTI